MQTISTSKKSPRKKIKIISRKNNSSDRMFFLIFLQFLKEINEQQTSNEKKSNEKIAVNKKQFKRERENRLKYSIFWGLILLLFVHSFWKYGILNQTVGWLMPKASAEAPVVESKPESIPTWSKSTIKFRDMIIQQGGSVTFQGTGGTETRTWSAGQSIADFLELGDFDGSNLNLDNLNLSQITQIQNIDLTNLNLSDFRLINWQSLSSLTEAIPELKDKLISEVKVVSDLVQQQLLGDYVATIGDLINQYPELATTKLSQIVDLSQYKITDIPGIEQVSISAFENWQNSTISGVPGLSTLTWDNLTGLNSLDLSFVAKVDIVFREVEANRTRSISGSYQEGFNVPCLQTNCAHAEMSGIGSVTGTQWISGKYQKVKGGFGLLKVLNGGKEPTGRNPFGSAFKQVVWDIDEATGTMQTTMFFRICKTIPFIGKTCSPYFIGPVPFIEYREKDPIILGLPNSIP